MGSSDEEIADACASLPGGCTPEEMPQLQRETPVREVTVSAFQIDAREVTNEEYAVFLEALAPQLAVRDDSDERYPRFVSELATGTLMINLHPKLGDQRSAGGASSRAKAAKRRRSFR